MDSRHTRSVLISEMLVQMPHHGLGRDIGTVSWQTRRDPYGISYGRRKELSDSHRIATS